MTISTSTHTRLERNTIKPPSPHGQLPDIIPSPTPITQPIAIIRPIIDPIVADDHVRFIYSNESQLIFHCCRISWHRQSNQDWSLDQFFKRSWWRSMNVCFSREWKQESSSTFLSFSCRTYRSWFYRQCFVNSSSTAAGRETLFSSSTWIINH